MVLDLMVGATVFHVLSDLSSFAFISLRKTERFTLIAFLLCDCLCYVSLPRGILGWYVVCDHGDCGISWSNTLL